ncbi:hypothetical protein K788_00027350 [Paraburkholderia caribensis MBA4]|uniref:Uncharacterized protein n=1 Tax=Paraburkholderia caribensis MBA4 TaxID=1323664 RepID=A0A0P0RFJ1_9BURK|nr:hypothetical protein K788_00027350 [Paraburkholderia caribensis MBA4]
MRNAREDDDSIDLSVSPARQFDADTLVAIRRAALDAFTRSVPVRISRALQWSDAAKRMAILIK